MDHFALASRSPVVIEVKSGTRLHEKRLIF
jgi:hypothetical protein